MELTLLILLASGIGWLIVCDYRKKRRESNEKSAFPKATEIMQLSLNNSEKTGEKVANILENITRQTTAMKEIAESTNTLLFKLVGEQVAQGKVLDNHDLHLKKHDEEIGEVKKRVIKLEKREVI